MIGRPDEVQSSTNPSNPLVVDYKKVKEEYG